MARGVFYNRKERKTNSNYERVCELVQTTLNILPKGRSGKRKTQGRIRMLFTEEMCVSEKRRGQDRLFQRDCFLEIVWGPDPNNGPRSPTHHSP